MSTFRILPTTLVAPLGVFVGAGLGGLLRWSITGLSLGGAALPGLIVANLLGSFLIGVLTGWSGRLSDQQARMVLAAGATGFCGGLTSFSGVIGWWWTQSFTGPLWGIVIVQAMLLGSVGLAWLGGKVGAPASCRQGG